MPEATIRSGLWGIGSEWVSWVSLRSRVMALGCCTSVYTKSSVRLQLAPCKLRLHFVYLPRLLITYFTVSKFGFLSINRPSYTTT